MADFPHDQFDDLPDDLTRVGAHRAPAKRGRGWLAFLWAVLAAVVLVAGGLFVLSRYDSRFALPIFPVNTPTPTPTPIITADPVTDPASVPPEVMATLTISVLNGTPTTGLSNTAGDQIHAAGWPDPARANASARDEEKTVVYYSTPELEGIARGLVQLLGAGDVELSSAFPGASITVVLGSDYVPPTA